MRWSGGFGLIRSCATRAMLVAGFICVSFTAVWAQGLGPFVNEQLPPAGGVVIQSSPANPLKPLWIDVDGSSLDDNGDTHHAVPNGIDETWRLFLSPSRTAMVAVHGSETNCDDAVPIEIRVYRIPADDSDLISLGSNNQLRCLLYTAFDDRAANPVYRTAVFYEGKTSTGSSGHLLWWNLVTGEHGRSAGEYTYPINPSSFSQSGTMASVPNDVSGINGAHYSPVELCPAWIGQASIPGPARANSPAAYVENGTPNRVVVYRTGSPFGPIVGAPVLYVDCSVPSEPYGACCSSEGCQQTHQGDCTGTWQQGVTCQDAACPIAVLEVSLAGPATAVPGTFYDYTLTARNTGALASSSVTMIDRVPSGVTFVSASGGGTYSASTQTVTWTLGTLGAGAQTTRTLRVQVGCFGSSFSNNTYSITGLPGGTVIGAPPITTTLVLPNTAGLSLTLISSALAPTPLQTGDRVRHTVRIGNSSATNFDSLSFTLQAGTSSEIAQIVNQGGGYVLSTPTSLSWKGNVPSGSTLDVIYETAIKQCRSTQATTEAMNRGIGVIMRNPCSSIMASASVTQSFAVAPSPFRISLESSTHGPVQWWGAPDVNRMIACRPGATVDLEVRFYNNSSSVGPASSITIDLPPELPAISTPPFLGSVPAGTVWNSTTRTISWSGQPAANDSVVIRFRTRMSASACKASLEALASYGACTNALLTELAVLAVPVPPANHLLTLHNSSGLRFRDTTATAVWQSLLCGVFENSRGMGRTADGTIWVAGQPCFRLNPYQLSFAILPPSFATTLGMDTPFDVAEDPRDHTLVFAGYQSGLGLRMRRYDPATGTVSFILNDTSPQTLGIPSRVVVSPDGIIGANTSSSLMRINPANPAAYQRYLPPGGGSLNGLTFDLDGSWLTTSTPSSAVAPRNLMKVVRDTGVFSTLINLQPYFNWQYGMPGLAVAPNQDVYLGTYADQFGALRRSSGSTVELIPDDLSNIDLNWVGHTTTGIGGTTASVARHELALAGAIPNPARDATSLQFTLPRATRATLELFDSQGRRIRTLANGEYPAGNHTVSWNGLDEGGRSVRAGVYFARLSSDGATRRVQVVLTR
ncbi:MAG: DUF11 domain-containing protein [Candidatus Eisenbacteria bacterium]|uniref:DUF11 domain-containing protein n=1 Tax=Eiseniibacteriota bacterium TaxID=2212470 RepID=A0A849SM30_UNCEI|nr:DUF11 domain-containing protein [Candidatus Eisenbacteria bacterium]